MEHAASHLTVPGGRGNLADFLIKSVEWVRYRKL